MAVASPGPATTGLPMRWATRRHDNRFVPPPPTGCTVSTGTQTAPLPVVLAMMRFGGAVETASQTAELLADHG
jgi:hypothetical protein